MHQMTLRKKNEVNRKNRLLTSDFIHLKTCIYFTVDNTNSATPYRTRYRIHRLGCHMAMAGVAGCKMSTRYRTYRSKLP
jgi:hypothetical protein